MHKISYFFLFPVIINTLLSVPLLYAAPESRQLQENKSDLYHEPLQPIPSIAKLDLFKVKLGEQLFNDPRFGQGNNMACASCHLLKINGANHLPHTIGRNGQKLDVNTPTVFNSSLNQFQFWDGRAQSLDQQINFVVHSKKEFATSWSEIVKKLKQDKEYLDSFKKLYHDGISANNIRDAIATFERTLLTPGSRFDQYLLGNNQAITEDEKHGYQLFKSYGCIACHQGSNVGGNLFMRIGIFGDYLADRGNPTKADLGRFNVTGKEQDRYVFRVPSLRLAALTAPYFHDGSVKSLPAAIKIMAKYQLGRIISEQDIMYIEAFIKTLPGKYKGKSLPGVEAP